MKMYIALVLAMVVATSVAQRSPFASRPVGYPIVTTLPPEDGLGNRFGDDDTTTMKLPIEALGDAELVRRLSKLPTDQQPFWLLNWLALEANRKNPQTFQQRPNSFVDQN
ncbi:uncharacterized protein LOC115442713 [Manduca sexta]|uniref:Uncharacterized protein n=1 Tax=Manduca sexta TaxID=7130 RepID=A0A921Z210_MANSE|nr:uncharacterized protein LOC115442713 [Manduca sexta]KAG6448892.1 hypothetical protein O3G_MSEX005759 [Manduca sexta]KAG6448893.1 hypothetical protein O3G_MSEX005759 [Manduca sexta]